MRTKCPLRVRKADIKNSLSEASFEALPSRLTVHFRDAFIRWANQFWFSAIVSSPKIKNILLHNSGNQNYNSARLAPTRGAYHDRHDTWGAGCDGRFGVRRFYAGRKRQGVRRSRVVLAPRCWRQVL